MYDRMDRKAANSHILRSRNYLIISSVACRSHVTVSDKKIFQHLDLFLSYKW